jgi:hypothetical protein
MKHLKRFNELNITGTYLDKTNIPKSDTYSTSGIKKITSDLLSKKGKIFKDEPTTTSEPILNFKVQTKSGNKTSYRIIFPTNFLDQDTDTTTMYNLLDDSDVVKIPMKELLEDKFIVTEGKFNRIHFTTFEDTNLPASDGVPRDLRGIGLGYLIYDNFIKHLGFASSNNNHTSNESMSLWNKIATDPDFLCILLKEDKNRGEIMAIHKGFAETEKIAFEFIENLSPNTKEILIDDELMKLPKVVEIKTKFDSLERDPDGFVKTIKDGKEFVYYRPFRIGEE